jgi:hypothetical protein
MNAGEPLGGAETFRVTEMFGGRSDRQNGAPGARLTLFLFEAGAVSGIWAGMAEKSRRY